MVCVYILASFCRSTFPVTFPSFSFFNHLKISSLFSYLTLKCIWRTSEFQRKGLTVCSTVTNQTIRKELKNLQETKKLKKKKMRDKQFPG